jgi:Cellulase (glycosyl hydrolase family 5)
MKSRTFALILLLVLPTVTAEAAERWPVEKANAWYERQQWLVGVNYIPATAVNVLEMWQESTFDPERIDLELGWAENIRMNTIRVFLHDLLWQDDSAGLISRISRLLDLAERHHIRVILVLFDSCWDPQPRPGEQPPPRAGIHNSRWVQSPGTGALKDPQQYPRLERYVKGVITRFAEDARVLAWDLWNEPDNTNVLSYSSAEPDDKQALVDGLLAQAFAWAREAGPTQPLISAVWHSLSPTPSSTERIQMENADVMSFHDYEGPEHFESQVEALNRYGRPVLCTEYMARPMGSTFQTILPLARRRHVGAISWGLVAGKTQTFLPWDSWQRPYVGREPALWFHDIFRFDGSPYRTDEIAFLLALPHK